jgi:D-arginine dehydrogenase
LLISPADQTPLPPQDVHADEFDVAVAVDRFEAVTNWTVPRVTHHWAGLRTMAPDNEPILGFDLKNPDFLWAVGFGGFGVQAAFAAGRCAEALLTHRPLPAELTECGVNLDQLSPSRLVRSWGSDVPSDRGHPGS